MDLSWERVLFREKIRRDLVAVIEDPRLVKSGGADDLQREMNTSVTRFLDTQGDRLARLVAAPSLQLPLGKWFEQIFLAALRITFPFDTIHHSVRTGDGGELDFLIQRSDRIIHVECAVKFYLCHGPNGYDLSSFIGPGGRDRLDLKLGKMKTIQLKRSVSSSLLDGRPLERVLWMGGRIFIPAGLRSVWSGLHPEINPHSLRGEWLSLSQLRDHFDVEDRLILLPRQWWITALGELPWDFLNGFKDLEESDLTQGPALVVHVQEELGRVRELGRYFVVPG